MDLFIRELGLLSSKNGTIFSFKLKPPETKSSKASIVVTKKIKLTKIAYDIDFQNSLSKLSLFSLI